MCRSLLVRSATIHLQIVMVARFDEEGPLDLASHRESVITKRNASAVVLVREGKTV